MMRFWRRATWFKPKQLSLVGQWTVGLGLFVFSVAIVSVGCDGGSIQGKTSLHEMDHEVAAHWPESLEDAADKIRQRISVLGGVATGEGLESVADPKRELLDILSWVPEIAADTDMSEAAWVPLAEESEKLHARLKTEAYGDQLGKQVLDFAEMIATAWDQGDSDDA